MSWTPRSSQTGGAQENTPPPNLQKSLGRFQGLRTSLLAERTPSKLLPRDAIQERILKSQQTTTAEIVLVAPPEIPSQADPAAMDDFQDSSGACKSPKKRESRSPSTHPRGTTMPLADDSEDSSVGTWNSPKEREAQSPSVQNQDAPLPAPLHVIQTALSTTVALRPRSFSTASLASSSHPAPSDGFLSWEAPPAKGHGTSEKAACDRVNPSLAPINDWREDMVDHPLVDLTNNLREDCDIDPTTGKLIPPVRYIKLREKRHKQDERSRMDRNSEGHILREIALRSAMKEEIERKEQEEKGKEKYANKTFEEDKWPNANCTLRPVEAGDFQGIADIINLEMKREDSQIFLSKVEPADIATLYNTCLAKHRPFIVAIPSPTQIPNRSGWSKAEEEAYQEFIAFKKSRQASQHPSILGFAFVTHSRQGFLGGVCSGSRFSGYIKLVVHPNHRGKLVGSALLDRIMLCTAIYHRSLVDYTWDCSETKRTYEYVPAHNQQKYNRLYLETFFTGNEDPRIEGITRFLEKYDFARVAHFKEAVKHGNKPGVWKDLVVWEHEARSGAQIMED